MTTLLDIKTELGNNIDLLIKPNEWLENHRRDLANQASIILEQLDSVQKVQRFKRELRRNNLVAVLLKETKKNKDVAIKIMPMSDALELHTKHQDNLDRVDLSTQFYI